MFKKMLCLVTAMILLLCLQACDSDTATPTIPITPTINGVNLSEFSIVYNSDELDYCHRAAQYIQKEIETRTGLSLPLIEDDEETATNEIIVGETNRDISAQLDVKTEVMDFTILATDDKVAMEGKYFTVAAAAYYFVDTYITDSPCEASIPKEALTHKPITKEVNNIIFLIGDGMGTYQTQLFDYMTAPKHVTTDGEDLFYGYLFPAQGFSRTNSYTGTTDSAAGGTALSSGMKTNNGYVGIDRFQLPIKSLTELAGAQGKATAIMSTDVQSGATPAAFSAHVTSRDDTSAIYTSQLQLQQKYGTVFSCGFNTNSNTVLERNINNILNKMTESEKGFFLMYEEAHIDKYCHNQNLNGAFEALIRFNQAIGLFMEYAFYHPDTFVIITADHETGKLSINEDGKPVVNQTTHSSADVPVFAYGHMSECFDDNTYENVQIPKTLAKFLGDDDFGDISSSYAPLF